MLRVRTGYSFRRAVGQPADVVEVLREHGRTVAPITDTGSTFGWQRFAKAARKAGLRPAFGVELGVTRAQTGRIPTYDRWTFLARDTVRPVNDLVALAYGQYWHEAGLLVPQAFAAAERVTVIMGHKPMLTEEQWAAPVPGVYLALAPSTPRGLAMKAIRCGWPLAASSDNRFPRPGGRAWYETLCGRSASSQTYPQHILSDDEWRACVAPLRLPEWATDAALHNASAILAASTATLQRAELPEPERPDTLANMCRSGAARLGCDLTRPEYAARLARELEVIAAKGYEDYFYIVADVVAWARKRMLVGPARGSSCGSLVCYLLGITAIDPIPYGLIFERFVDLNRKDMPDIDIDFSDTQRHHVFAYIAQKYGRERVARIGAVALYRPRSALDEISGALGVPKYRTEAVVRSIGKRAAGDERALNTIEDAFANTEAGRALLAEHPEAAIAVQFEGHPRHYSQHAAGVVIARDAIANYVAIDPREGVAMCDKVDAEAGYNLLKIDALGLTSLSIFEDCLALAGLAPDALDRVPLDDPDAFGVINAGRFSGLFQFSGGELQKLARQVRVESLNDIVALSALARPGPINSGAAAQWVRRRMGLEPVRYAHPLLEPHLHETLGVVIYQEQVMQIGRDVGGLSWEQVSALRKAMSKSAGAAAMDAFGDPFKEAAVAKGMPRDVADGVWSDLCKHGAYGFNKSHSVAYAVVSYWAAYLKGKYPHEYAAAMLTHEGDADAKLAMLREARDDGITHIPVDVERSTDKWTVIRDATGAKRLLGPLQGVEGVGPQAVKRIMALRQQTTLPGAVLRQSDPVFKKFARPRTDVDSLEPITDALRVVLPDPRARNIVTPPTRVADVQPEAQRRDHVVLGRIKKLAVIDENEPDRVKRRDGRRITDGATTSLNLWIQDDTGTVFAKVRRHDFERIGVALVDQARVKKTLVAVKGYQPPIDPTKDDPFRMIVVEAVRMLGDLDIAQGRPMRGKGADKGANHAN